VDNVSKISIKDKIFAHVETWRPYTVIWCGLLSFTGASLINNALPPIKIAILSLIIPIMGWIAGLYLADYLDKNIDSIEKSHRPIPSGRIKPNEALAFGGIFALIGTILTFLLTFNNLILIFLSALLVFSYARFSKSKGFIGNLNRGTLAMVSFYFGVFSIGYPIESIPLYIFLLSFVFLIHDMNTNIIGAIRDVKGDKKGGYQTIPVKYGISNSLKISTILLFTWLILTLIIVYKYGFLNSYFYLIMTIDVFILALIIYHSIKLLKNFTREKALNLHKLFIMERITLASAFLFGTLLLYQSIIIYLSTLILSGIFQHLLRNQYEFNKWTL
jgi:4-hydroxybenzoate polyprenyltransferase/geranylgeranylglycerol-phosphate geranylgeranyltransferase